SACVRGRRRPSNASRRWTQRRTSTRSSGTWSGRSRSWTRGPTGSATCAARRSEPSASRRSPGPCGASATPAGLAEGWNPSAEGDHASGAGALLGSLDDLEPHDRVVRIHRRRRALPERPRDPSVELLVGARLRLGGRFVVSGGQAPPPLGRLAAPGRVARAHPIAQRLFLDVQPELL